jgi:ATP-dependent DNA helicase RecG
MLTGSEIETQLRLGEDSITEFKGVAKNRYLVDKDDLAKAIVALANREGGHILLGVEKDGSPTGVGSVEQADALMRQVMDVCLDGIRPAISCVVRKVEFRGTPLIVLEVPSFSQDRPYRAGHIYWIRDGNRSREALPDELRRLLQSADYHYDEQKVSGATQEDFDGAAALRLLAPLYGGDVQERNVGHYLRALNFVDLHGGPTVAGILFVGKDVSRWFPDARISAVRFEGTAVTGTFADRVEISGRLPEQIEGAAAFLSRHISSPSTVKGWDRVERPGPGAIPDEALREAVMNAVAHRDYRMASQTTLFVFDDRVELTSPGSLLNRLTLDNIKVGGIKQHRNPVIASLMARLLSARRESLGIGIPEMIRLMKEHGLPEPEFDIVGGHFRVTLRSKSVQM